MNFGGGDGGGGVIWMVQCVCEKETPSFIINKGKGQRDDIGIKTAWCPRVINAIPWRSAVQSVMIGEKKTMIF